MYTTKVYANTLAQFNARRMDGERLRRLVEAGSVDAALKMLADSGFPTADGTIDGFIVAATDELIEFIEENAASSAAADALTAVFWYNNVKLAYKSRFAAMPTDAYYKIDRDAGKIAGGDYSDCDRYLTDALEALDAGGERRPQAIDLALTRAMYAYVLSCGVRSVERYFRTEIDLKNILTAARLRRLGAERDEFIDGGTLDKDALIAAASQTTGFADAFIGTPYADAAEAIEANGFGELWRAERDLDDHLYCLTDRLCARMTSFEPFLNYYTRARIELKAVKTALVCVKTGTREAFFERCPKLYG